jgi:hypothetical protein
MNRTFLDILKTKEFRGNIIETLYRYYGEDISLSVLKAALPLSGLLKDTDIRSAIYYLGGREKEYVHLELNKSNYMDSLIWLTPKGINLAEGDIVDVGVKIDG